MIDQREQVARAAIREVFGTPEDEYAATIFVSTHLEHQSPDYWLEHLGTEKPDPQSVLDILVLRDTWGGDDELMNFDFTLPGNVADDVICVRFDAEGNVVEIVCES